MSSTLPPIPLKAVEFLFDWMTRRYGALFLDMWSGLDFDDVKQAWREDLAGFNKEELQVGLAACRQRDFPPTLPQFMRLCRPQVDHESAFHEASHQMALRSSGLDKWSSPAVYWAAVKIGAFDLRNGTWSTMKKRWSTVLDEMLADPNLPAVPSREQALLPAPVRTLVREGGLSEILNSNKSESEAYGKSWAVKIFRKVEAGEPVQASVIRMAEEALGRSRPERLKAVA